MKTSSKLVETKKLTGAALDWAVAKCIGFKFIHILPSWRNEHGAYGNTQVMVSNKKDSSYDFCPSTDWAQGGPIIEREQLCLGYKHQCDPNYAPLLDPETLCWARTTAGGYLKYGPTTLIAAMRSYVASKLGSEVNIPEELL